MELFAPYGSEGYVVSGTRVVFPKKAPKEVRPSRGGSNSAFFFRISTK
jgi:hypothetical protein